MMAETRKVFCATQTSWRPRPARTLMKWVGPEWPETSGPGGREMEVKPQETGTKWAGDREDEGTRAEGMFQMFCTVA